MPPVLGPDCLPGCEISLLRFRRPVFAAMTGHIHCQFQAAPDAKLVEGIPQMILDDLLAGPHDFADFAIGHPLPDKNCDLDFFWSEALARHHDCSPSRANMAIASFTRLRPSRIPARRKRVRRCCFTVRGLILSCPAISLLLQPCTSKCRTC